MFTQKIYIPFNLLFIKVFTYCILSDNVFYYSLYFRHVDAATDGPIEGERHGSVAEATSTGPQASILRLPMDRLTPIPGVPTPRSVSHSLLPCIYSHFAF